MNDWTGVTKTGTLYEKTGGHVKITPKGGMGYVIRLMSPVQMLDHDDLPTATYPWKDDPDSKWVELTVPKVGQHVYVSGSSVWRISTPLVTVAVTD